jgi:GNAT superfamily N-acetyltransferase
MKLATSEIRMAQNDDLYPLVGIAMEGNQESSYGLGFNEKNATEYTWGYIDDPDRDIIVAEHDGEIVGGAMVATSLEYHDSPFCYVCKFWVSLAGRMSGISRAIMSTVLVWAKDHGCSHVFLTATAGLDAREQKLFINLAKKFGFIEEGPVLSLGFRGEE